MDRLTKQEISGMPPYTGLPIECIEITDNPKTLALARAELSGLEVLGFDTESKPTSIRGEKSTGPHLIQLASEY